VAATPARRAILRRVRPAADRRNPQLRLRALRGRDPDGSRRPTGRDLAVFAGWVGVASVYIVIGLVNVDFLLSFWVALGYVVIAAWLVPATIRRLR
jgi:hypothetical protein